LADERWLVVGGSVAEKQPSGDALIDEPSRHLWWALPSLPVQLKGVVAVRSALESFLHYGLAKSIDRSNDRSDTTSIRAGYHASG